MFLGNSFIIRILTIFSLLLFGVAARKFNIIKEDAKLSLANIIIYITLPPLVFVSISTEMNLEKLLQGMLLPLIFLALALVGLAVALGYAHGTPLPAVRRGTFLVLCIMPNTAFIGFPVVFALLGQAGLAHAILFDFGSTIAFFSLAVMLLTSDHSAHYDFKTLLNPPIIAVILGILALLLKIEIARPILEPFKIMGSATTPLAMLYTGYVLGGLKFKPGLLNWDLGMVCLLKLLIFPMAAIVLTKWLHFSPVVESVIIIESAMPCMASTPILIQKYGGDEEFAAVAVLVTTVLSAVTIPIILKIVA